MEIGWNNEEDETSAWVYDGFFFNWRVRVKIGQNVYKNWKNLNYFCFVEFKFKDPLLCILLDIIFIKMLCSFDFPEHNWIIIHSLAQYINYLELMLHALTIYLLQLWWIIYHPTFVSMKCWICKYTLVQNVGWKT